MSTEDVDNTLAPLSDEDARAVTERIRTWVRAFPTDDVANAYTRRVWVTLGYESWGEYCDSEFDGFPVPTRSERGAIVLDLAGEGMSARAIADVIGVDRRTVDRAIAGGANAPRGHRTVIGKDGKEYHQKMRAGFPDSPQWDDARDATKLRKIVRGMSWVTAHDPRESGLALGWDACAGRGELADRLQQVRDWLDAAIPAVRG